MCSKKSIIVDEYFNARTGMEQPRLLVVANNRRFVRSINGNEKKKINYNEKKLIVRRAPSQY